MTLREGPDHPSPHSEQTGDDTGETADIGEQPKKRHLEDEPELEEPSPLDA